MLEIILKVLKKNNIDEYIITETEKDGVELYLIKKDLDMNRKKDTTIYTLTVFRKIKDGEEVLKGDSTVIIYPSMDEGEIEEIIKSTYYAASFVKNKVYEIPKGYSGEIVVKKNKLSDLSLDEIALRTKNALYKYDNFEKGFINSAEIFVTKVKKRIITSKGADASYEKCSINGEFITQWVENQDVEIYNSFSYEDLEEEELSLKAKEAIENTGYRDKSQKAPKTGNYDVILSGDNVQTIFSYYLDNSLTSMVYQKYSKFNVGDNIQGNEIKGDKIGITITSSVPFSNEGIELKNHVLIEDGVLKTLYGSYKFAEYLGLEPIGDHDGAIVNGGKTSFEEMFKDGNLKILRFSDFQMDTLTGDFYGEIRLALLKQGNNIIPLTGGSMSANIKDVQENIILSKELQRDGAFTLPLGIKFSNVKISGI